MLSKCIWRCFYFWISKVGSDNFLWNCTKKKESVEINEVIFPQMVRPSLLFLFGVALTVLSLVGCQGYVIVTSPSSQSSNQEISLKVFFSTKTVSQTHTVTSTITQSVFPTCYATEPGIVPCQRKRDFGDSNEQQEDETHEPKVVLNGQEAAWETFITPSRVSLSKQQN